jgi:hypothetical protein
MKERYINLMNYTKFLRTTPINTIQIYGLQNHEREKPRNKVKRLDLSLEMITLMPPRKPP